MKMGAELRSQSKDLLDLQAHPENPEFSTEQVSTSQEVCQNSSSKFITCHRYTGNSVKSSSPAHWHKEIEIMHFIEGTDFSHTCQCRGETFDAPAIVVVPSNLIHRTCYAPNCKVNRILFKGDSLRLHEADKALENCLKLLRNDAAHGSLIIRKDDPGFEELTQALSLIENLGDEDGQTFDPSKAQEDSIKQDKVDAYVAATFANPGTKSDDSLPIGEERIVGMQDQLQQEQYDTLPRSENSADLEPALIDRLQREERDPNALFGSQRTDQFGHTSSMAINAGSIAIALAQNFATSGTVNKPKSPEVIMQNTDSIGTKSKVSPEDTRQMGLNLQFKAFLINFLGLLTEFGYFSDSRGGRKPRATRYNDEKIKLLLKHIHDNYNHPMNISQLAKMLQVTNQYFCRYFKQLTDMSFIDYLNDLRLQKAAQEIATTQQSIREISTKHGFDTIGYFFKLFRERYNTTPIGYRNRFTDIKNRIPEEETLSDAPSYEPHIVRRRKDRLAKNVEQMQDQTDVCPANEEAEEDTAEAR